MRPGGFDPTTLDAILARYRLSFMSKTFSDESSEIDVLMSVFGLTQSMKMANKQYFGRELGYCWQMLVTEICRERAAKFNGPIREASDEICDLRCGQDAIDTKYRIGSGDSGTLKKFRSNAARIKALGYRPVLLILRQDNLPAALAACRDWHIVIGPDAFAYLEQRTDIDLQRWLTERRDVYAFLQERLK